MITSTSLFAELTTTELVQLKDSVDVQVERLRKLIGEAVTRDGATTMAGWHKNKSDLSFKLSAIIEARLEEERA
jgi:hypothetical protein